MNIQVIKMYGLDHKIENNSVFMWVNGRWMRSAKTIKELMNGKMPGREAKAKPEQEQKVAADFSLEYLKSVLNYDPIAGVFTWVDDGLAGIKAGSIAGTIASPAKKFRVIGLKNKVYRDTRLAHMYMTGALPRAKDIPRRDGDASNASWDNIKPEVVHVDSEEA